MYKAIRSTNLELNEVGLLALMSYNRHSWVHKKIYERGQLLEQFDRKTDDDGYIYVVTGGIDCDCVQYSSKPIKMVPTLKNWFALQDRLHAEAEGPVWARIIDPSDKERIKAHSRDLALEAFEDGHPGTVCEARYEDY